MGKWQYLANITKLKNQGEFHAGDDRFFQGEFHAGIDKLFKRKGIVALFL